MAKFCSNCGSALSEGVSFCAECGARVVDSAVSVAQNHFELKTATEDIANNSVLIQDEIAPARFKESFLRLYSQSCGMVIANVILYIIALIVCFMYRNEQFFGYREVYKGSGIFEMEWVNNTFALEIRTWAVIISAVALVAGLICLFLALNVKLKPMTTKAQLRFGVKSAINARAWTMLGIIVSAIGVAILAAAATASEPASSSSSGEALIWFIFLGFIPIYIIANICVMVIGNKIANDIRDYM